MMSKLFLITLWLLPTAILAGPPKDVNLVLDREPYLAQASGTLTTPGQCEADLEVPAGLVIETVSFSAATEQTGSSPTFGNYSAFEQQAVIQVVTRGVAGSFFFPTENRTYVWRSNPMISPAMFSTAYRNSMSIRLYPDAGSAAEFSFEVNNENDFTNATDPPAFSSCTLWISGYLVDEEEKSGLSP